MSKFSEYLKSLIEQNGETVASLARNAGIERTSIHKAITGERNLSYKSAKRLTEYLRLSPHETKVFFQYYDMQLQGENTFETRLQIIQLLKTLQELSLGTFETKTTVPVTTEFPALKNQQIYSGAFTVKSVIRQAIDQELNQQEPALFLNLPMQDSFLLQYLYTVYQQYSTPLTVTHIIPYQSANSPQNTSSGISILQDVLTLSLSAGIQYSPYFFYDKADCFSDPFPFYLLTSSCLLCIARGYETVLCMTEPAVISHYQNYFQHTLDYCSPLLTYEKDPFKILDAYEKNASPNSYYTFMPQPCMGKFYTSSLIAQKLRNSLPYYQKLVQHGEARFSVLRALSRNYYTFFTKQGLNQFMADGVICDMPRQMVAPFTPAERYSILDKMRAAIRDDVILGRLTNDAKLSLPENLSFCISEKGQIDIFSLQQSEADENFYNIHIREPLIVNSFLDFVLYLPKSEYLLSKEDTLAYFDQILAH